MQVKNLNVNCCDTFHKLTTIVANRSMCRELHCAAIMKRCTCGKYSDLYLIKNDCVCLYTYKAKSEFTTIIRYMLTDAAG